MRKLISLLMAVVMVFSMATTAFAATMVPSVSATEIEAGSDVTITLSLDEPMENMISLGCLIGFNPDHYEFKEAVVGEENSSINLACSDILVDPQGYPEGYYYRVNYVDQQTVGNTINQGVLYTLTFTAKQDLAAGTATQFDLISEGGMNLSFQTLEIPVSLDVLDVTIAPEKIPVTSVGLSETSVEIALQGIKQLSATVSPDNATDKTVTWTSSNEAVATVNAAGIVSSVAVGETVITATADGVSATCNVTVYDPATRFPYTLTVNGEDLEVTANGTTTSCMFGEQSLFEVTVPADATEMLITFDGESMSVVDDSNGVPNIIGQNVTEYTLDLTQGYAEIHLADNDNNVHRHVKINVAEPEQPAVSITLDKTELAMSSIGGESYNLTLTLTGAEAADVVWATSNADVAAINAYPQYDMYSVQVIGPGECDITATVGDVTATCHVTVADPENVDLPFTLSAGDTDLEATYVGSASCIKQGGRKAAFEVTVPADAATMLIVPDSSDGMTVVNEVDGTTLAANGTMEYEVDLTAGYETLCLRDATTRVRYHVTIKVAEPEQPQVTVTLNETALNLSSFAGSGELYATVTGSDASVVWATTNESVAHFYDYNGGIYVEAVGPGECDITATVDGVTATCHVVVTDPVLNSFPFTITVDGNDVEAVADGTEFCDYGMRLYKYVVTVPADAQTMHLSYDNESAYVFPDHGEEYLLEGGVDCDVDLTQGYQVLDLWDAEDPNLSIHLHIEVEETKTIPVTGITLDKTELTVTEGNTGKLTATVAPADATDKTVTWSSADGNIATVENGVVTAVAAGNTTITAKAGEFTATCAVTVKAVTPGYTFATSADVTAEQDGQAIVHVKITGHTDENITSYNAYDVTMTFDSEKLELVDYAGAVKSDNGSVTVNGNEIRIVGCGATKTFQDELVVLTFKTKAEGAAEVNVSKVQVSDKEESVKEDAPEATPKHDENDTTNQGDTSPDQSVVVVPFSVTKPNYISGKDKVLNGADYTFSYTDTDNYTYTDLTVTVGGSEVTPSETDGVYTITGVNGAVVITATRTANSYDVTKPGSVTGLDKATYGKNYVFTVTPGADMVVKSVTVTLADGTSVPLTYDSTTGQYTIAGTSIAGAFTITVEEENDGKMTSINFSGITSAEIEGGQLSVPADINKDFKFKLIKNTEDYSYTVMVGQTTLTEGEDGYYTIPGNLVVKGSVTVTITKTGIKKLTVDVNNYITLDGKVMFLVTAKWGDKVLAYGEDTMFYSSRYTVTGYEASKGAYCWLVMSTDEMNTVDKVKAAAEAAIVEAGADATATAIAYDCDVNRTTVADVNDAQLVYDMYNASYEEFTEDLPMRKFLEADMETNMTLDTTDVAAIINALVSGANS